jgi:hypothetical protein
VDVKKKEKKRKKKKKKYSKKHVCLNVFFYGYIFSYDETAKHKEGFNILIGSRGRNTNLYGSCISKIR